MPDVVQQCCDAHDAQIRVFESAFLDEQIDDPAHDSKDPKRMSESAMAGVGVHERREPELLQVSQALKRWRVNESLFKAAYRDFTVNWIADDLVSVIVGHSGLQR
jgi:hypothetical protein